MKRPAGQTKRIVIVGMPTLDFVMTTPVPPRGGGTIDAVAHTLSAWPRVGGAAYYTARPLAAAGFHVSPLVFVGDDINGRSYLQACRDAGLHLSGIVVRAAERTPCCVLIHHTDGGYTCLLDRGTATGSLAPGQVDLLAAADLVVLTAADPRLTKCALSRIRPDQRVAWIAKDDPACFPGALCRTVARRADTIFCNHAELPMIRTVIEEVGSSAVIFETRGARGACIHVAGIATVLDGERVATDDATGAGDTFAGAALTGLLIDNVLPVEAARRGIESARRLLLDRSDRTGRSIA